MGILLAECHTDGAGAQAVTDLLIEDNFEDKK